MRIVGGVFKGRKLKEFSDIGVRPTSDMAREAVFNILRDEIDGASFLDLFAGTGAMGLEALSRGAEYVCFNDSSFKSRELINHNLASLGIKNGYTVLPDNAESLLANINKKFDIVYLDPPYKYENVNGIIELCANVIENGIIVLETETPVFFEPEGLKIFNRRRYGRINLTFYKKRVKKDVCLFAGTFDPVTLGHVNLVDKLLKDFDKVIVGLGQNPEKTPFFSLEKRLEFLSVAFKDKPVIIKAYSGYTVDFMKENGIKFTARGIRNKKDLKYEKKMAAFNASLSQEIETIFIDVDGENAKISSTLVREKFKKGESLLGYVPQEILPILND